MFVRSRTLLLVAMFLAASVSAGYSILHLKSQRDALWDQKQGLEKKQTALEKKYQEEKARVGDLLRLKASWEREVRTLQGDLEKLRQEHLALLSRTGGVGGGGPDIQGKVQSLEGQVAHLKQSLERSEQEKKDIERRWTQALQDLQERIAKCAEEKSTMESDLRQQAQFGERCRADNARLAALMDELMQKFRQKGLVDSLLQKEPFTQIKRVELEELLQKYAEARSDHVLPTSSSEERP